GEAPLDGGGVVRAPRPEPAGQLVARRRQDEDGDAVGARATHLPRALPVDLEDDAPALRQLALDLPAAGAVAVIEDASRFEQLAARLELGELGLADEEVVAAFLLGRPLAARRVGDREDELRVAALELLDERRLARAGRRGDHEQAGCHFRSYSTFCICSRICSMSTLTSTAARVVSVSPDLAPSVFASRFSSCMRKSSRRPTGSSPSRTRRISSTWLTRRSSSSSTSSFWAERASSAARRAGSTAISRLSKRSFCFARAASSTSGMRARTDSAIARI